MISEPPLTTCLLATKYRNRQQTCSEEWTDAMWRTDTRTLAYIHTQTLLPAPESGHRESSCHRLVLDQLSPQSRKRSHLFPYDSPLFQSHSVHDVRSMWHFFPSGSLCQMWDRQYEITKLELFVQLRRSAPECVWACTSIGFCKFIKSVCCWIGWLQQLPGIPQQQTREMSGESLWVKCPFDKNIEMLVWCTCLESAVVFVICYLKFIISGN